MKCTVCSVQCVVCSVLPVTGEDLVLKTSYVFWHVKEPKLMCNALILPFSKNRNFDGFILL